MVISIHTYTPNGNYMSVKHEGDECIYAKIPQL
jgi:hypothetical protein